MKTLRSERGFAHVLLLLLVAIVIAAVGYAAYVRFAPANGPSGASPSKSPTASTSRVAGVANYGPTSPVCRSGQPCVAPYRNRYQITITPGVNGQSSTVINSAADGSFSEVLPPGHYTLTAKTQLSSDTQEVTVTAGKESTVTFSFDSGIR